MASTFSRPLAAVMVVATWALILTGCIPSPVGAPPIGGPDLGSPGSASNAAGCRPTSPGGPPAGAAVRATLDVDGDGRPDQLWLGSPAVGPRTVGITTASGATSAVTVGLTGPVPLRAFAADVDEQAPIEVVVSDGRAVLLFVFEDCALQPVRAADGSVFVMDLGFRQISTGVGCIDADRDGRRDLVSLRRDSAGPERVAWSRTIVRLDAATAIPGPSDGGVFSEPADHESIQLLSAVSCGDRLMQDALVEPRA